MAGAWLLALIGALATLVPELASAQADEDFLRGKTVTILVGSPVSGGQSGLTRALGEIAGSSSGGDYESYANLLSRFLGSHLPGRPRVIVEKSPGEGGLAPIRYLERSAPADGAYIAMFDSFLLANAIIGADAGNLARFHLSWVGNMAPVFRVCYVRGDAGARNWDDLARGRVLAFGADGLTSPSYFADQMLRSLFKRRIRTILGYRDRTDIHYAIARGELDGGCGSVTGLPSSWLGENAVTPIVRLSKEPIPDMVRPPPYIGQFAKTEEQRGVADLLSAVDEIGRPVVMAGSVAPKRLNAIRAAFDATLQDRAFVQAAEDQNLFVSWTPGEATARLVRDLYATPPSVLTAARHVVQ